MRRPFFLFFIAFASMIAQTSTPSFEVATIKIDPHCETGPGRSGGGSSPGRLSLQCADLRDLILTAYGIYGTGANPAPGAFRMQVVGGPSWIDSTRYDIIAKAAGDPRRSEMYGPMLRSLLERRFGLKVHRQTTEGRVYFLTIAKSGSKLRAAKEGSCETADNGCGQPKIKRGGPIVAMDISGGTIADLCTQLNLMLDGEVIDRTGFSGRFDIHLELTPEVLQPKFVAGRSVESTGPPAAGEADAHPSIFTELQQQLGLKLKAGKGPVEVIVVDRIQQATEN